MSLLKKVLHIDMYNTTYFPITSKYIISSSFDLPSYRVDESAHSEHHATMGIPSITFLFEELSSLLPAIESISCASLNDIPDVTDF